jgi:hypothetical protein
MIPPKEMTDEESILDYFLSKMTEITDRFENSNLRDFTKYSLLNRYGMNFLDCSHILNQVGKLDDYFIKEYLILLFKERDAIEEEIFKRMGK